MWTLATSSTFSRNFNISLLTYFFLKSHLWNSKISLQKKLWIHRSKIILRWKCLSSSKGRGWADKLLYSEEKHSYKNIEKLTVPKSLFLNAEEKKKVPINTLLVYLEDTVINHLVSHAKHWRYNLVVSETVLLHTEWFHNVFWKQKNCGKLAYIFKFFDVCGVLLNQVKCWSEFVSILQTQVHCGPISKNKNCTSVVVVEFSREWNG